MSLSHPNDIMQITCLIEDYVFEVNQQMTTDNVQWTGTTSKFTENH